MPDKSIEEVVKAASGAHFSSLRLDSLCLSSSTPSSPSSAEATLLRSTECPSSIAADAVSLRQPFVIGVCGGTASGKTTVCDRIIQQLHDHRVVLVNQDSFYRGLTAEESKHVQDYNFDHPDAFDTEQLLECMKKLKSGYSVNVPIYDFKKHQRCPENFRKVNASDVIILEGILVFHDSPVRDLMNMKIFVDTDPDPILPDADAHFPDPLFPQPEHRPLAAFSSPLRSSPLLRRRPSSSSSADAAATVVADFLSSNRHPRDESCDLTLRTQYGCRRDLMRRPSHG